MSVETLTCALDFLILAWLVGTWFYEGHHRNCRVEVRCPACGLEHNENCCAGERREP